jgi:hypothetical protein
MKTTFSTVAYLTIVLLLFCGAEAIAQESSEIENLNAELEQMRKRIDELEKIIHSDSGDPQKEQQLEQQDQAAGIETAEPAEPSLNIGGAVWVNYANQSWLGSGQGKRGLRFDNLRLSIDGDYDQFLMSAQYRWYNFSEAIHHAFFGYAFEDDNRVELGISQVPFGILPFRSHNFWFMIPYYVGLEDDYDAGIKWHNSTFGDWTFDLAFYINEEYGDTTNFDRYSVDVVREGEQQNEERNQFNIRLAYDWKHTKHSHTELGVSGRYGDLDNRTTNKTGDYWSASVHANAFLGPWNLMLEGMRYEYNPKNPAGVSNDLVLMANLSSKRLVAAKADIYVANIAYDFGAVGWKINRLNCYNNYSYMDKDVDTFMNSQLNDIGCLVTMGPFWIWIDYILGKNAWYLNDSETDSGFGAGGTDEWERRLNVNFEWYF